MNPTVSTPGRGHKMPIRTTGWMSQLIMLLSGHRKFARPLATATRGP
jgi:hypothetical protein